MKTYVVHLAGEDKQTACGLSLYLANDDRVRNGREVLPEGDYLSPFERLCQHCARKGTDPMFSHREEGK